MAVGHEYVDKTKVRNKGYTGKGTESYKVVDSEPGFGGYITNRLIPWFKTNLQNKA